MKYNKFNNNIKFHSKSPIIDKYEDLRTTRTKKQHSYKDVCELTLQKGNRVVSNHIESSSRA